MFPKIKVTSLIHIEIIILIPFLVLACKNNDIVENASPEYKKEIDTWHSRRINNLKKENSWLNLAGLFWLKEGENKFGSSKTNDIIFPEKKAPDFIGSIFLNDSITTIKIISGIYVYADGNLVSEIELKNDMTGKPTLLELGSLKWYIIKRGDKYGIRLRDIDADLVKNFEGIERFPVNENWKIEADFEPYNPPKEISIPTILGTVEEDFSPGVLKFKIDDKDYTIDPVSSGKKLFIIFADETSGEETYGAGRFLYANGPDSTGKVIIDFNKAYNPPCAFTKYATCSLPPKQNHLRVRITAGEKNYGESH